MSTKPPEIPEDAQLEFEEMLKRMRREEQRVVIVRNSAKCLKCGEDIESTHRHDFVSCSCGSVCVDGGKEYLRRCGNTEDYEDTSICKEVDVEQPDPRDLKQNRKA